MSRSHWLRLCLLLSLVASLFAWSGCNSNSQANAQGAQGKMPPLTVQVAVAESRDVPITTEWIATMDGYVNAQIKPQVSGYLVRQNYREGSFVHKGDVLFDID